MQEKVQGAARGTGGGSGVRVLTGGRAQMLERCRHIAAHGGRYVQCAKRLPFAYSIQYETSLYKFDSHERACPEDRGHYP